MAFPVNLKAQDTCIFREKACWVKYFESDYMENLELIDTASNIWEYGYTDKSINYVDKVFITDTLNPYPPNNLSSFKISCSFPAFHDVSGYPTPEAPGMAIIIQFAMAIDTDKRKDGGTVEVSFDDSVWHILGDQEALDYWNTFNYQDPRVYIHYPATFDTLPCLNKPGFSGSYEEPHEGFKCAIKSFPVKNDSVKVYLKFTFCSDSIDNNREGWMIDNLIIVYRALPPIDNIMDTEKNNEINLFPCPSGDKIKVKAASKRFIHSPYEIVNINGQIVKQGLLPTDGAINIATLKKGLYFFKIGKQKVVTKKFIKE